MWLLLIYNSIVYKTFVPNFIINFVYLFKCYIINTKGSSNYVKWANSVALYRA